MLVEIKFHQTLNVGAARPKDILIRLRGQKVKGQGHNKTTHGHISTPGGICSPISGMQRHI